MPVPLNTTGLNPPQSSLGPPDPIEPGRHLEHQACSTLSAQLGLPDPNELRPPSAVLGLLDTICPTPLPPSLGPPSPIEPWPHLRCKACSTPLAQLHYHHPWVHLMPSSPKSLQQHLARSTPSAKLHYHHPWAHSMPSSQLHCHHPWAHLITSNQGPIYDAGPARHHWIIGNTATPLHTLLLSGQHTSTICGPVRMLRRYIISGPAHTSRPITPQASPKVIRSHWVNCTQARRDHRCKATTVCECTHSQTPV
jgi:hypothetical protein